jgi:hypothetical protein
MKRILTKTTFHSNNGSQNIKMFYEESVICKLNEKWGKPLARRSNGAPSVHTHIYKVIYAIIVVLFSFSQASNSHCRKICEIKFLTNLFLLFHFFLPFRILFRPKAAECHCCLLQATACNIIYEFVYKWAFLSTTTTTTNWLLLLLLFYVHSMPPSAKNMYSYSEIMNMPFSAGPFQSFSLVLWQINCAI